jgi:hypothetical protein
MQDARFKSDRLDSETHFGMHVEIEDIEVVVF